MVVVPCLSIAHNLTLSFFSLRLLQLVASNYMIGTGMYAFYCYFYFLLWLLQQLIRLVRMVIKLWGFSDSYNWSLVILLFQLWNIWICLILSFYLLFSAIVMTGCVSCNLLIFPLLSAFFMCFFCSTSLWWWWVCLDLNTVSSNLSDRELVWLVY